MALGFVNGEWVRGAAYTDVIQMVRGVRPLQLGFCGPFDGYLTAQAKQHTSPTPAEISHSDTPLSPLSSKKTSALAESDIVKVNFTETGSFGLAFANVDADLPAVISLLLLLFLGAECFLLEETTATTHYGFSEGLPQPPPITIRSPRGRVLKMDDDVALMEADRDPSSTNSNVAYHVSTWVLPLSVVVMPLV